MAAKIPTYEQRGQVGALPGTPRATAPTALGQALQDAGSIGRNFVADEQRRMEHDEREAERRRAILEAEEDRMGQVEAHKIASRLELETIEDQVGLEDAYARAPFGHGERVAESFDKRASKALESVPRPRARWWLEQHVASMRTQRMVGAIKWERAQADKNALADLGDERDAAGARAMQDDAQYAPAVEKFTSMAELLGKRGDERVERAIDEIAYQAAQGRVARDPGGTLALLDQRMG